MIRGKSNKKLNKQKGSLSKSKKKLKKHHTTSPRYDTIKEDKLIDIEKSTTPLSMIQSLKENCTLELLRSITVSLNNTNSVASAQWASQFICDDGIQVMMNYLSLFDKQNVKSEVRECCITIVDIIASLMHHNSALDVLVYHVLDELSLFMNSSIFDVKQKVLQILTVLCSIRGEDINRIIYSFDYFAHKNKKIRYEQLVLDLKFSKSQEEKLTIFSLINAIIKVHKSCDERMRVRNDVYRVGLEYVIDQLLKDPILTEQLEFQIHTYLEDMKHDQEELKSILEDIETSISNMDMNNPIQMSEALNNRINKYSHLMSPYIGILKSLFLMPMDKDTGYRMWVILESIVSQMRSNPDMIYIDPVTYLNLDELLANHQYHISLDENDISKKDQKEREFLQSENADLKKDMIELKNRYSESNIQMKAMELDMQEKSLQLENALAEINLLKEMTSNGSGLDIKPKT